MPFEISIAFSSSALNANLKHGMQDENRKILCNYKIRRQLRKMTPLWLCFIMHAFFAAAKEVVNRTSGDQAVALQDLTDADSYIIQQTQPVIFGPDSARTMNAWSQHFGLRLSILVFLTAASVIMMLLCTRTLGPGRTIAKLDEEALSVSCSSCAKP